VRSRPECDRANEENTSSWPRHGLAEPQCALSRRIESSQYHFILEMTWTMPSRFAFVSVVGFTNNLHVSIAFATEWTDLLAWQNRHPSRPEQLAVSSREQSRLGPSAREGIAGRRQRSASFCSPDRSFSDQLVQAVPSATISCLCLFVQSNFRPFAILLGSNHPSRVLVCIDQLGLLQFKSIVCFIPKPFRDFR
jgi:hypothetical protein